MLIFSTYQFLLRGFHKSLKGSTFDVGLFVKMLRHLRFFILFSACYCGQLKCYTILTKLRLHSQKSSVRYRGQFFESNNTLELVQNRIIGSLSLLIYFSSSARYQGQLNS